MLPGALAQPLDGFARAVQRLAGPQAEAVYLVGSPALGDYSARQSNVDLVVVSDPPLEPAAVQALRREERPLERAGRPAAVWHTGWEEIAYGPAAAPADPLETPLTRALLRDEAVALFGPDWPVVSFDGEGLRSWCRQRVEGLAGSNLGLLILRRDVSPLVLEVARLAIGAATGRACSKSEAGHAAIPLLRPHFRRILDDCVGYRRGAHTSNYWGPFERKYDALRVIEELARLAGG